MDLNKKLSILEEIMDLGEGVLKLETVLSDLEAWDSVSMLAFASMLDEEFGKNITVGEVRSCVTVSDLVNMMEK